MIDNIAVTDGLSINGIRRAGHVRGFALVGITESFQIKNLGSGSRRTRQFRREETCMILAERR
jgi:hypothetical protein